MQFDQAVDLFIVCMGTCLHLNRISPFGAGDPNAVMLVPNVSSTLLTVTLLTAMTKWRPIRGPPRDMTFGQVILRLLVEMSVIIFSVEFLLVWMWIPILVVLSAVCEWAAEGYLDSAMVEWLNGGFFIIRFLLAAFITAIIALSQGWIRTFKFTTTNNNNNNNNNNNDDDGDNDDDDDDDNGDDDNNGDDNNIIGNEQFDRPIIVRHGGGSIRNRNVGRFFIRSVTLNESTA